MFLCLYHDCAYFKFEGYIPQKVKPTQKNYKATSRMRNKRNSNDFKKSGDFQY